MTISLVPSWPQAQRQEVRHLRYHKDHILGHAGRQFRRIFPERQIFFRSRGEVRFIRLSPKLQAAASSVALALVIWTAAATVSVLTRDARLTAKNRQIDYISNELGTLMTELGRLESEAIVRAEKLEKRQAIIERVAGSESEPDGIPYLPSTATSPEGAAAGALPQQHSRLDPSRIPSKGVLQAIIGAGSAEAAAHRPSTMVAGRLDALISRLDALETRQVQSALLLAAREAAAVDERRLVIDRLGLSLDRLLGKAYDPAPGMGGPYIETALLDPEQAFNLLDRRNGTRTAIDRIVLSLPSVVPAKNYYISSDFGKRIDPFHKTRAMHSGVDMAGWIGEPILAAGSGKIVKAARAPAYGNMIEIDHGNGFRTRYGHMRKLLVKAGETVMPGQTIGEMGATGRATSTHLHWEVWYKGKLLDPHPFIEASEDVYALQSEAVRHDQKS